MNTSESRSFLPSEVKEEEEEPSWKDKPLHRMYHWQINEVADIEKSYQWLEKPCLEDSTEALFMSAQD